VDLTFHGTDDQLENYALGRLSDSELPAIEEHLMVCAGCRERVDRMEEFALGMRDALLAGAAQAALTRQSWLSTVGVSWLRKPAFSLALGFALLMAVLLIFSSGRNRIAPTAALQLTAIRGEMPFSVPARETDLTLIDVPPTAGHFRIEVLDATGRTEWNGMADSGPRGVEIKVQRRLRPGDYFVRLYDSAGEVLHEYGFRVHQ
jgi:hypothetical protein